MKYLSYFESFKKILEQNSSSDPAREAHSPATPATPSKRVEFFEKSARQHNIDLEDENVQMIICDILTKKIENSTDSLNLNIDMNELSAAISEPSMPISPQPNTRRKNESTYFFNKISESANDSNNFRGQLNSLKERLKDSDNFELEEMEILKSVERSRLGIFEVEKMSAVKAALHFLRTNPVAKGIIYVLYSMIEVISIIPNFILGVIQRLFNWILRKIFGTSHETTSKVSRLFFPLVSLAIITFVFIPLIGLTTAALSGVAIMKALCVVSIPSLTSASLIFKGLFRIFSSWITRYKLEPKEEIFTFLEYLDELEKISGKKIEISLKTRKQIEKIDMSIGSAYHSKKPSFQTVPISEFLMGDAKSIYELTQHYGFNKVKIRVPAFDKIVDGIEPSTEDFKKLQEVFLGQNINIDSWDLPYIFNNSACLKT